MAPFYIAALTYPRDHDLDKPESTLPEDAFTQVTVFLAN